MADDEVQREQHKLYNRDEDEMKRKKEDKKKNKVLNERMTNCKRIKITTSTTFEQEDGMKMENMMEENKDKKEYAM